MGNGGDGAEDSLGVYACIVAHVGLTYEGAVHDAEDILGGTVEAVTEEEEDEIADEEGDDDMGEIAMAHIERGKGAEAVAEAKTHEDTGETHVREMAQDIEGAGAAQTEHHVGKHIKRPTDEDEAQSANGYAAQGDTAGGELVLAQREPCGHSQDKDEEGEGAVGQSEA